MKEGGFLLVSKKSKKIQKNNKKKQLNPNVTIVFTTHFHSIQFKPNTPAPASHSNTLILIIYSTVPSHHSLSL